jgi:hypothetical protein
VAPTTAPRFTPPPASSIEKQCGWWSRPRNLLPSRASFIGVRPNSPPHTTSVSSSSPRAAGRPAAPPARRSSCAPSSGTASSGRRRGWCRGCPSRNRTAARSARRARRAAAPAGSCWPATLARRGAVQRVHLGRLAAESTASGTDICMRNASSYCAMRVDRLRIAGAFLACSRLRSLQRAQRAFAARADRSRPDPAGRAPDRRANGTRSPGAPTAGSPALHSALPALGRLPPLSITTNAGRSRLSLPSPYDPGPHRRPPRPRCAGEQQQLGGRVVELVGDHRAHQRARRRAAAPGAGTARRPRCRSRRGSNRAGGRAARMALDEREALLAQGTRRGTSGRADGRAAACDRTCRASAARPPCAGR